MTCIPEIQSIKKFTLSMAYKMDPDTNMFIVRTTLPPNLPVDVIVIRDVKWICNPEDEMFFSLWTNITNDIVAGMNARERPFPRNSLSTPPVPDNEMEFRIKYDTFMDKPRDYEIEVTLNIDLEFISYKKN